MSINKKLDSLYENGAILAAILIFILTVIRIIQLPIEVKNRFIPDEWIPITISLLVAITLPFIIRSLGKIKSELAKLPNFAVKSNVKGFTSKVQTLNSQDALFDKLLAITLHSSTVYTCMFSDPPKMLGGAAGRYFTTVHKELRKKRGESKFHEFKRMASVGTKEKAEWLLDILLELFDVDSFSLAIKDIPNSSYLVSIHTCFGENGSSLMLWPTMMSDLSGVALLVQAPHAAKEWKAKYDIEYKSSIPLKTGKKFHWENIERMAKNYDLSTSKAYVKLQKVRESI